MQFMQRAASAMPTDALGTEQEKSAKRRKFESKPNANTDSANPSPSSIDAIMMEEDIKRERALERLAEEVGETKWEFSTLQKRFSQAHESHESFQVDHASQSDLSSDKDPTFIGRKSFGKSKDNAQVRCLHFLIHRDLMVLLQRRHRAAMREAILVLPSQSPKVKVMHPNIRPQMDSKEP